MRSDYSRRLTRGRGAGALDSARTQMPNLAWRDTRANVDECALIDHPGVLQRCPGHFTGEWNTPQNCRVECTRYNTCNALGSHIHASHSRRRRGTNHANGRLQLMVVRLSPPFRLVARTCPSRSCFCPWGPARLMQNIRRDIGTSPFRTTNRRSGSSRGKQSRSRGRDDESCSRP
jgi:hypothetical protein